MAKQIFIQVDTESVELLALSGLSGDSLNTAVLEHTLIYQEGSMAMGNSVKTFPIEVTKGCSVYFTLLPLKLFTSHSLAFNYIDEGDTTPINTVSGSEATGPTFSPLDFRQAPLSCGIQIPSLGDGSNTEISLNCTLKLTDSISIDFSIDPKLQPYQG